MVMRLHPVVSVLLFAVLGGSCTQTKGARLVCQDHHPACTHGYECTYDREGCEICI